MSVKTAAFAATMAAAWAGTAASAETRDFDVAQFDRIEASNGAVVEVTVGPSLSVRAEGPSDELERIYVNVRRGRLYVRPQMEGLRDRWDVVDTVIYVTAPSIVDIESENGAELTVTGLDAAALELEATNGGELTAEGRCGALKATARRGGELDAEGVACARAVVRASMGGEASVRAEESVDVGASWGASVSVAGSPERIEKNTPLSADIHIR